jgi:predicted ATPase/DNA-binding winged helix-turn-helix (wHTH) protein
VFDRHAGDAPEVGGRDAGKDHLDPYTLVGQLLVQRPAEGEHEGLRTCIHPVENLGVNGNKRGDIDDCSDTAGDESRNRGIGQPRNCAHVQRDHLAHLVNVGAEQWCGGSYPRVVHQNRDARIGPQHFFNHREIGWLAQVGGQHLDFAPGPTGNLGADDLQALSLSRNQNKIIAAVRQSVGIDRTDAGRRATDQGHARGILEHLPFFQTAEAGAEKAALRRLHNNCVAHMIILLGAAWPRMGLPWHGASTLAVRPVLLQDCANFPPIAVFSALALSFRASRRGKAKAVRPIVTEAVRARVLMAHGRGLSVKPGPHGANLTVDLECNPGQAVTKVDAMITERVARTTDVISFGPFTLVASERLLMKDGAPVELGSRTLEILIALVSRPNEVVGKRELLAQVWPDVTVEEGSLRFHIAGLRKALSDGKDGARYITTHAGRGYCFVAPILPSAGKASKDKTDAASIIPDASLPARSTRMVGRADSTLTLSVQLAASRFVTIVGSGGVGKTTVAVAVAYDLLEAFAGSVLFVDLAALLDADLAAISLASMLGLSVQSDDPIPGLIAYLRDKKILLILDNCEHIIEAAASLAERVFLAAPQVHILATSREALRVQGERVHRLTPLSFPPEDPGLSAEIALTFPAVQLFLERAEASGIRLDLNDADAAIVANICRKLDGVPLAIELAAGRVEAYGLQETAALLEQRLTLPWLGQRTAPPRQRTLQATLDWSYGLLSPVERLVLRRLAVFVGHFTLEAARAVVTSATIDQVLILGAIGSLVAKSMVATNRVGTTMRYRLLDTTRAYALEINVNDAEPTDFAARHATYYRGWLEQNRTEWSILSTGTERAPHLDGVNNVRAALEWCFSVNGDLEIGVGLAAAAVPAFLAMSLMAECQRWSERALLALDEASRGGHEEMQLQAALGLSLIFTRGMGEAARVALKRGLAIAEERDDALSQMQLLCPLHMFHFRIGDFKSALYYGKRTLSVAAAVGDPAAVALSHTFMGIPLHVTGELESARVEFEAAVQHGPSSQRTSLTYLGFDKVAGGALARTLWWLGYPTQAEDRARQSVEDAAGTGHPVSLSVSLLWAVSVFLWTGNLESAEEHLGRFVSHAESHSLGPYLALGRGYRGELAIRRGDAKSGVESLQRCLEELHAARYEVLAMACNIPLVQGLAALGQWAEGITLVNEAIRQVEANGGLSYLPELLRVKGSVLLSMPQPMREDAERCFLQSLDCSRRTGARAWELRTAIDLAELRAAQGRPETARAVLQPVFEQFVEGLDTADLKVAERLLATLS